jgi:chromosome segregation ATPase
MRQWALAMVLAALAAGGCGQSQQPVVPAVDLKEAEIARLKARIELLQNELASLNGQLQEIQGRDERLVSTIRQLQTRNRQLEEQVRVLAPAPAERDTYKARAEALSAYVLRLEREVKQLGGTLPLRGGETTPPTK